MSTFKNARFLKVLDDIGLAYPKTNIATFQHYMNCFVERKVIPMPQKKIIGKILYICLPLKVHV